jgi:membrane-associated phospholipid phosphatase
MGRAVPTVGHRLPRMPTTARLPSATPARRWWRVVAVAAATVVVALGADRLAWGHLVYARVYEQDWGRLLRVMGYAPLWLLLGLVVAQHAPVARWRGGALALAPLLAGALAELLKVVLRRERPPLAAYGAYVFRPWSVDLWSTKGLGLPSSHTMVAMAAATVLAHAFPKGRWLWYGLAVGCGLTRVAARAHYLSDVAVALIAGWIVGSVLWTRLDARNETRGDAS